MSESKVYALSLDKFIEAVERHRGVRLSEAGAGIMLTVETQNTVYTIHVIDPQQGEVLLLGGKFFSEPTHCTFSGSTLGSMLATGWLGLGFCLEFRMLSGETIITTPVRSIAHSPPQGHHTH